MQPSDKTITNFKDSHNNQSFEIPDKNVETGFLNVPRIKIKKFVKSLVTSSFTATNLGTSNPDFEELVDYFNTFDTYRLRRENGGEVVFSMTPFDPEKKLFSYLRVPELNFMITNIWLARINIIYVW